MMGPSSIEFARITDVLPATWPEWRGHRPNMLVVSRRMVQDMAVTFVLGSCAPPYQFCSLPGDLLLPETRQGTLLLWDVALLTPEQQIALYFWLGSSRGDLQIVSVTAQPVDLMMERGEFFDRLYYRLNIIRLDMDDPRTISSRVP